MVLPDRTTRRTIEKATADLLRDAGVAVPPVRIERLLAHLEVHREFYDLENPSFLRRAAHRLRVGGERLINLIRDRVRLAAVWLPDDQRILIDRGLPAPKQDWAAFHEATHRLLVWHREYFLGDTAATLDPGFQERLEAEANYGASALRFLGPLFTTEARDVAPLWDRIQVLHRRYKTSLQSTARRYVEFGPDLAMLFVVSTPWWEDVPADQPHRCRHVIPSPRFTREFAIVGPDDLRDVITGSTRAVKGGPAGDFDTCLFDSNGDPHEFTGMHFYNRHDVLTLVVHRRRVTAATVSVSF